MSGLRLRLMRLMRPMNDDLSGDLRSEFKQQNKKKLNIKVFIVKLRQGSGKDWQGMAVKAKGLKA